VHFAFLNFLSIDGIIGLKAQEISDELFIGFIIKAQLPNFIVFELWVVLHLLWDSLSSEDPHSFDFKLWFLTYDSVHGPGVLSEVINSLQESIHKVNSLVKNSSFSFIELII